MATYKSYLQEQPNYLELLSSLSTFVNAVRGLKTNSRVDSNNDIKDNSLETTTSNDNIGIQEVIEFYDLMISNNLTLANNYTVQTGGKAVELMTAHGSKGLEFDDVYVLSCVENTWNSKRGRSNKIGTTLNLKILPESENTDDALRLFYVALTRAKQNLILTRHLFDSQNKPLHNLACLENLIEFEEKDVSKDDQNQVPNLQLAQSLYIKPINITEKDFFAPILKDYKMSVTHLNNFLNITGLDDSTRGGPQKFLEINLLRFPQRKNASGAFGTAMHESIRYCHLQLKMTGSVPETEVILKFFEQEMLNQRLSKKDYLEYLSKGYVYLPIYLEQNRSLFNPSATLEFDFASQQVRVGEARITGKIDKLEIIPKSNLIVVTDYKTGKSSENWTGKDLHSKIKLNIYERQLVFYKLLVENSKQYGDFYKVETGKLEFLQSEKNTIILDLDLRDMERASRLSTLIQVVWNKIMNLDFPDTSHYPNNLDGIEMFIDDLIEYRI